MSNSIYFYGSAFKKFSDEIAKRQKANLASAKDEKESKTESKANTPPHIAAAIHILSIYQKKRIAHHKKVAGIFSELLSLFDGDYTQLQKKMKSDTHANEFFKYAVAKTLNYDIRNQKLDTATHKQIDLEIETQQKNPSLQVRNTFLGMMLSNIINNITLADTVSDFGSICLVISRNLNLHLEEVADAKVIMAANYSKRCFDFWNSDKRRQAEISKFEKAVNTELKEAKQLR